MSADLTYPNGLVYGKYLRDVRPDESCPKCQFKESKYIIKDKKIYKKVDAFGTGQ
jgi:hypothetical protein